MRHYSHGEVNIFEVTKIPSRAKKINKKCEIILAESETTGNHHCLEVTENCEVYENGGVFYLRNTQPVRVYCKFKGRHDEIVLEPSIWEIDRAQEYDYLTMEKRYVAD